MGGWMEMSGLIYKEITNRIIGQLNLICHTEHERFKKMLIDKDTIFVAGAGRSGLIGKCFAMRLMHLGKQSYFVGETTTPKIKVNHMIVCISSSGNTASVINVARVARQSNAHVTAITTNPYGELSNYAHIVLKIPQLPKAGSICLSFESDKKNLNKKLNVMPMGTLFELSTLIFLESLVAEIIKDCGIGEIEMKERHTNLE
jgi:6-phospho-3-hexuloisomerase